jgi:hypothetical protein
MGEQVLARPAQAVAAFVPHSATAVQMRAFPSRCGNHFDDEVTGAGAG